MFINKKNLLKLGAGISLSAAMLLSGVSENYDAPQTVEAASSYRVCLKHNAYVYNYRGEKIKKVL
ncbi:hypothetical protein ODV16_08830 [Lactobacillus amylovorus]|nr:hypothetical protein [Lactobacillus amylovorus]MDB6253011.1 hypothetical protein [Lactobacillus amylovorus]